MENKKDGRQARFDLSVPQDLYDSCQEALDRIVELSQDRPLAAIKISLKLQLALRRIERNAALRGNQRFKISWTKIGEAMGFGHAWAWERYNMGPTRAFGRRTVKWQLTGEMRDDELSEKPPSEVEEKPENEEAESSHE